MTPNQIIAKIRELRPLASEYDSLQAQRAAMKRRAEALGRVWNWPRAGLQDDHPDGFWEEDSGFWCFCAFAPAGHFSEANGCLFTDGQELGWMCAACRRPAHISVTHGRTYVGDYGSAAAYEHYTHIETRCCGAEAVLPNGESAKDIG